ncbi:hypothetical protein J6590_037576 [Homalodisca vitripennis]|nr:hypothetical protein J6590_037576 [Homalodisca vitripennis]
MNTTGQGFAELTHLPWIYTMYDSDGTIGLGFQELAHNATPFFYNLIRQNRLKEPIFSFYINRDPTTTRGGSLFFGGIDPKHNKTAFSTINVNSNVYWQFPVTNLLREMTVGVGKVCSLTSEVLASLNKDMPPLPTLTREAGSELASPSSRET